jgi:hypothetical protein
MTKDRRFEIAEAYLKIPGAYDEIHEAIESGRARAQRLSTPPPAHVSIPPLDKAAPDKKVPDDDSRYMPKG